MSFHAMLEVVSRSHGSGRALLWTGQIRLISQDDVLDARYEQVSKHFHWQGSVALTLAIVVASEWNRLAIVFRAFPVNINRCVLLG